MGHYPHVFDRPMIETSLGPLRLTLVLVYGPRVFGRYAVGRNDTPIRGHIQVDLSDECIRIHDQRRFVTRGTPFSRLEKRSRHVAVRVRSPRPA